MSAALELLEDIVGINGGAIIGVAFVELGKFIEDVDDEVASSLYALFLSQLACSCTTR